MMTIEKDTSMVSIPANAFDQLQTKLQVLEANLQMIMGAGFDGFHALDDHVQHGFLLGCSLLADECSTIASEYVF
jgi:hypothetical protein